MMVKWMPLSACAVGLAVSVVMLFFIVPVEGKAAVVAAVPADGQVEQSQPTVMAVTPGEAPNNLDMTITITGTEFQAVLSNTLVLTAPVVSLDGFSLADVGWVSSRTLTATVPWGLDPGIYTATVTNPDGGQGTLPNALAVEQAIGVWTTGGPYGGLVWNITASPVTSQTAFATELVVGLYRTLDGGNWWDLVIRDPDARGVRYGIAPAYPLFYWGRTGLWRSDDAGQSFHLMLEGEITAFAPHPQDPQQLWAATPSEVLYTSNGGQDWKVRSAEPFTDTWLAWLAVDPVMPSTLYAVTADGQVHKSIDAGVGWDPVGGDMPPIRHSVRLLVNPFAPGVLLYCNYGAPGTAFRSTDGGGSWSAIEIDGKPASDFSDMAFSPHISGTVYAIDGEGGEPAVFVSHDAGASWGLVSHWHYSGMASMALDPASGLPLYGGGGDTGAWRTPDGGLTWERATEGIAGLQIMDIAVSPSRAERVLMAGVGAGGYMSDDAGHSWRALNAPLFYAISVAGDPQDPDTIYVNTGMSLNRSRDGGLTWEQGDRFDERAYWIMAEVAPSDPSVLYVGGNPGFAPWIGNIGLAYRSDDYGVTWAPLTFTVPVSGLVNVVVDPTDAQVVYVMAGWNTEVAFIHPGKGLFRSTDGGLTWEPRKNGIGDAIVFDLDFHPDQQQIMYASGWLSSEQKVAVFKTTDGGASWYPTALRMENQNCAARCVAVAVDPLAPDTVYAGTGTGLWRTTDGGGRWDRAAGSLGYVTIADVSAAGLDERTILYVGTRGGDVAAARSPDGADVVQSYVQSGVYQYTDTHRSFTIYLPLVTRDS